MSALAFGAVDVAARFSDPLVARLTRAASCHGSFVRRPTPREPFDLPVPEFAEHTMWVRALLGPGWVTGDVTDCATFDGSLPGLHVQAPELAYQCFPVLLHTTDPIDYQGPLWQALVAVEPTLTVPTQTLTCTWAFLGRSTRTYLPA